MNHAQRTTLCALLTLGCACAWAGTPLAQDTRATKTQPSPFTSRIDQDLRTLTSQELLGRGPDTEGLEHARDWVRRRFRGLGLEPAIGDDVLQAVPGVTVSAKILPDTELQLGRRVLARGVEYDVWPKSASGSLTGRARVVKANWSPAEAKGRLLVVRASSARTQQAVVDRAISHGAKGVVLVLDGALRRGEHLRPTQRDVTIPVLRVRAHVLEELAQGRSEIAVRGVVSIERRTATLHNVLAKLPGSPKKGNPLIIAAHYDGMGLGYLSRDPETRGALHPSADDNASGVAVMLDVAARLARTPNATWRRPVWVAALTGEELGLVGSRHLSTTLSAGTEVLTLDMLGRAELRPVAVMTNEPGSDLSNTLTRELRKGAAEVVLRPWRESRSDHLAFIDAGCTSVHLTTGRSAVMHTIRDEARRIDAPALERVAATLATALMAHVRAPKTAR
ncbi:MAG: M28 family peptidase [Myxococcota bacterium]